VHSPPKSSSSSFHRAASSGPAALWVSARGVSTAVLRGTWRTEGVEVEAAGGAREAVDGRRRCAAAAGAEEEALSAEGWVRVRSSSAPGFGKRACF
jgi:hypothetical protein